MKRASDFSSKPNAFLLIGSGKLLLFIAISLSSCGPYYPILQPGQPVPEEWQKETQYYIPTVFNVPMLDSSESAALSLNARTGDNAKGFGMDAVVRLSPKWAVTGNFGSYNMGEEFTTYTKQRELGAGYTGIVGKDWKWEAFTGLGSVNYAMKLFAGEAEVKTNYYFLQPAIYYHKSGKKPYFTIGFATRVSMQQPEVTEKNIGTVNPQPFTEKQFSILESAGTLWALEPGMVLRFGWKPVQLTAQYFGIVYLNASELHGKNGIFNLGLRFVIPRSAPVNK